MLCLKTCVSKVKWRVDYLVLKNENLSPCHIKSGLLGLENLCLQGKMEKLVAVSRNIFLPQVLGHLDCTQDIVHQYLAAVGELTSTNLFAID